MTCETVGALTHKGDPMKPRLTRFALVVLAAALGATLFAAPAHAKSYSMTKVDIEAEVQPDGSMIVTEQRTFDFNGDYTFAYWEIDKGGSDSLEMLGLSGPEGAYTRSELSYVDPDRTPQTYTFIDYGSYYDVRAYFRAADTEHTITLTYRVAGAATRWQDTSELYWQFVGDAWELPAEDVTVHIALPREVTRDDVRAWAHGPLTGDVNINDDGTVDLIVDRLPTGYFVEARVLFPAGALASAPINDQPMLEKILADEGQLAREANAERTRSRILMWGSIIISGLLPLVALGFAFWYWLQHGKEYKTQFQGEYWRELPADMPPAQVSAFMNMGAAGDTALPATLMDLIDRGVIGIERATQENKALFGLVSNEVETYRLQRRMEHEKDLFGSERELLDLLFNDMMKSNTFTMEGLKDAVKTQSRADEWGKGVTKFKKSASDEVEDRGFLEKQGTKASGGFITLGVAVLLTGCAPLIFADNGWFLIWGGIVGTAIIVLGVLMKRRTPEAAELAAKYKGVKNYLRDFGRMDEKPPDSVVLWRHFLTLAVVFGMAEEVMRHLQVKIPEMMTDPAMGTWMWMTTPSTSGMSAMNSLSTGVVSVGSIASSHSSSSSGGGGGFSGGGGGGGGGGGAGGAGFSPPKYSTNPSPYSRLLYVLPNASRCLTSNLTASQSSRKYFRPTP